MRNFEEQAGCGTAHCLLGWAAVHPSFGPHILKAHRGPGETHARIDWLSTGGTANDYLGISNEDSSRLFALDISTEVDQERGQTAHDVSKAEVLWNLDELIAGRHCREYRAVDPDWEDEGDLVPAR